MGRWDLLQDEIESANRGEIEIIEPTEEEKKNGWTKETLSKYLKERGAFQGIMADPHSAHRKVIPDEQNHRYRVHRWRE